MTAPRMAMPARRKLSGSRRFGLDVFFVLPSSGITTSFTLLPRFSCLLSLLDCLTVTLQVPLSCRLRWREKEEEETRTPRAPAAFIVPRTRHGTASPCPPADEPGQTHTRSR